MFNNSSAYRDPKLITLCGVFALASAIASAQELDPESASPPPSTLGEMEAKQPAEMPVVHGPQVELSSENASPLPFPSEAKALANPLRSADTATTGPLPIEAKAVDGSVMRPPTDSSSRIDESSESAVNRLLQHEESNSLPCISPPLLAPAEAPSSAPGVDEFVAPEYGLSHGCNRREPPGGSFICGFLPRQLFLHAWLTQGFALNPASPANNFNLPVTFNDRANEYQLNQIYLSLGREVRRQGCSWDFGGQVDFLYGTDYFFTTAVGLETHQDGSPKWNSGNGPRGTGAALYGFAMPQVFAEVCAPIGSGLSLKLGHFYTIMGYESVMAPENFFYSHAYTMQYGKPFTHTGLLADYDVSNGLAFQAGFTRGWDTWEDPAGNLAFLGGVKWSCPDGCTTIAFTLHTGDEDADGDNRTAYSLVCTRKLNDFLTYVLQHDLGVEQNAVVKTVGLDEAMWYGINQYLLCDVTEQIRVGVRLEWFRDEDNARVLGIPIATQTSGGNYFALTAGLNWKPRRNITLRPEIRWDHSNVAGPPAATRRMFNSFTDTDQLLIAADLIVEL